MKKQLLAFFLGLALLMNLAACGSSAPDASSASQSTSAAPGTDASSSQTASGSEDSASSQSSEAASSTANEGADYNTDQFADSDYRDVSSETPDATITLSGSEGTISDTTRGSSGATVTITSKGIYHVTGSSDGVQIYISDTTKSGNIYLVLDNVSMTNNGDACIFVQDADKVILQCIGEVSIASTNLSTTGTDGAIYAKDDITINGSGTLSVSSSAHGIVCKNDMKLTGASLTVSADSIGLKAGDSVRIGGTLLANVTSGHDGIQVENSEGDSYFYMEAGEVVLDAGYDGIDVDTEGTSFTGYLTITGGNLTVTAGGGSANSTSSTSQKGLRCSGDINLFDGYVTVSSADDSLHSASDITIAAGYVTLASSDDGIHADGTLTIQGGLVGVTQSYEGLEATTINMAGGNVSVTSSDDGLNAAGGSDSASTEQTPWGMSASGTGTLNISGGNLYVNAQGDGLDSNGSIYISGGYTIVEGPTNGGNGALDKGDSQDCVLSITGGTLLALGTADMAINCDSGTQCSALVSLSGSAGSTITVDDGSGFTYSATKDFACAVYSSPSMTQGNTYTITAGSSSATMDFSSSLYYSTVQGMGGMGGRR